MTKQIGHYTKENGLAENSIQKLLLQLAHNAGSMGFKRQDVYEGLHQVIIWAYSVVLSRFKSLFGYLRSLFGYLRSSLGHSSCNWHVTE